MRLPHQIEGLDGLIIPGGESTTLSRLMSIYHLREPVEKMAQEGRCILGTCAGLIMMAHDITEGDPVPLRLMDIGVQRNSYGRQGDSFEQDLEIPTIDSSPGPDSFRGIFIRAPGIIRVGPSVEPLAALPRGQPVAVRQGNLLALSFHPELTSDLRFHDYFLELVAAAPVVLDLRMKESPPASE